MAMSPWFLCVESATREHRIPVGDEKELAVKALDEAREKMHLQNTIVLADRLALPAQTIRSIWIEKQ